MNKIGKKSFNDKDDEPIAVEDTEKFCSYETRTRSLRETTVPLDGSIREAAFYRYVSSVAADLTENDDLIFNISSPGGDLDGLIALLDIINTTEANVTAVIKGNAHSAASMFAVSCPNVYVSPYATMLVHYASYSVPRSKGHDVRLYVDHTSDFTQQIFRDVYTGFLNEAEMDEVIKGREMWLTAPEIEERLIKLNEYRQSKMQEQQEVSTEA